jgi:acyl-coenzyme A thioesterase PaaI-like protein
VKHKTLAHIIGCTSLIMTATLPPVDHSTDHIVEVDGCAAETNDNIILGNNESDMTATAATSATASHLPDWVYQKLLFSWGETLDVPEWQQHQTGDGVDYRIKHGWQGKDLIHDSNAPVRVLSYHVQYGPGIQNITSDDSSSLLLQGRGGVGTTLRGIVHFTKRAESHQGYCHGGSMTSVLDDVIGWVAFLVTGECRPWTGFTVQVNCSLHRPIPVDSVLLVQAKIAHIERRKVSVEASIVDPQRRRHPSQTMDMDDSIRDDEFSIDDAVVHATGTGLVVMNRGVLPQT